MRVYKQHVIIISGILILCFTSVIFSFIKDMLWNILHAFRWWKKLGVNSLAIMFKSLWLLYYKEKQKETVKWRLADSHFSKVLSKVWVAIIKCFVVLWLCSVWSTMLKQKWASHFNWFALFLLLFWFLIIFLIQTQSSSYKRCGVRSIAHLQFEVRSDPSKTVLERE